MVYVFIGTKNDEFTSLKTVTLGTFTLHPKLVQEAVCHLQLCGWAQHSWNKNIVRI